MKKINLIIMLIALVTIFSGCGNVLITCTIAKDNNVVMQIDITLPQDGLTEDEKLSLSYAVIDLVDHWEDKDYSVTSEVVDDSYLISLNKNAKGQTLEDAVNELLEIMGQDTSPFSFVEGGYSTSEYGTLYNIEAEVDLSKILDENYIDSLPDKEQERISSLKETFTGKLVFDFIGDIKDSTGSISNGINTVELSLDSPSNIYSLIEIVNPELQEELEILIDESNELSEKSSLFKTLVIIAASLFITLAVALVIILLLKRKDKNKNNKSEDMVKDAKEEDVKAPDNNK